MIKSKRNLLYITRNILKYEFMYLISIIIFMSINFFFTNETKISKLIVLVNKLVKKVYQKMYDENLRDLKTSKKSIKFNIQSSFSWVSYVT